jgi:LacI family transcriptional regulator
VKVTIKEVARAAGVSPATVSRVFNDTVPVDAETRARVLAAAEMLRYVPNAAARSLITSRTGTIGVLLPDLHGTFYAQAVRGLNAAARQRGFDLLVSSAQGDHDAAVSALRAMRGRVDGVILVLAELDAGELLGELEAQPTVLLGAATDARPTSAVAIDEAGGAAAMVRHLVRHGHRRIALLTGDPRRQDVRARQHGYRQALADAGVPLEPEMEVVEEAMEHGGYRATARVLALDPRPTAIFAITDAMAIGALAALREADVSIPGEMAVAGFGDQPVARYVMPPLSSVRVPAFELGKLAIDRMLLAVARRERPIPSRDLLECTVVPRASCGVHETG